MIKYDKVVLNFISSSGWCADLEIDGRHAEYDLSIDGTTSLRIVMDASEIMMDASESDMTYSILTHLPLNVRNPKETLDRFFKLLTLT